MLEHWFQQHTWIFVLATMQPMQIPNILYLMVKTIVVFSRLCGIKSSFNLICQRENKYKIYETKMTDCVFAIEMKLDKMRGD